MSSLVEDMDQGGSLVDNFLLMDRDFLELSDLLQITKHTSPTVSGLTDLDYPSFTQPTSDHLLVREFGDLKHTPLPAELVEQFGHMQCNCMMGIFPEISRAWLSIDSDIFVWNYEDGTDLAYFDGVNETILCVGLVKPKPGMFQPHITYLLCLATPVDIILLGVSFSKLYEGSKADYSSCEMHLLPEPLFSIPTDNIHFVNICGSESGRIFLAGKDACMHEVVYQAEAGWFSRKCRKVNHSTSKLSFIVPSFLNFTFNEDDSLAQICIDESRHILYTRSEKGAIQVFDLGDDGMSTSRVAAISSQTLRQMAGQLAKTIDRSNFDLVIHISPVSRSQSSNIHLVAITHTGIRVYFTTCSFTDHKQRPVTLSMVHVRLPPGFSTSASVSRPSRVHAAHLHNNNLLFSTSRLDGGDILWSISSDSLPFQRQLMETYETLAVDGNTWAMSTAPSTSVKLDELASAQSLQPPLVVTQHMESSCKYILLNSQGSYIVQKLSPLDQLKELLIKSAGTDSEELYTFFKLHRQDQVCALCLILACSNMNQVESQVSEWAAKAFFLYGGEAEYNPGTLPGNAATIGASAFQKSSNQSYLQSPLSPIGDVNHSMRQQYQPFQTPAPGLANQHTSTPYNRPIAASNTQSNTSVYGANRQEFYFSGRHNGLCLYLCRILRPIWNLKLVTEMPCKTSQGSVIYLTSSVSSTHVSWFSEQLLGLRDFVRRNPQFTTTSAISTQYDRFGKSFVSQKTRLAGHPDSFIDDQTIRKHHGEVQAAELASLQAVHRLVERACESLALWKLLCDHQLHVILSSLTKDQQQFLRTLDFRTFIISGKKISNLLMQCLIQRYINDNAATDAISDRLREICPSLYSPEDAIYSKANEMLQAAKLASNPRERNQQLDEALLRYKEICLTLDIQLVCTHFIEIRYFTGVVDLALTAAAKRDPQCLALHFYHNGKPADDYEGQQAYKSCIDCYSSVTDLLVKLRSANTLNPQAPSIPSLPGPPSAPADLNSMTLLEASQYTDQVFDLCIKSKDQMFHIALYDWLIEVELTDKLLEIESPYLQPYLMNLAAHSDKIEMLNLLWRYHEKTRNFSDAAKILSKLSERRGSELSLQQRVEYLSRAIMSAKSCTMRANTAADGEFLHDLEEKMEVARIQLGIYEALHRVQPPTPQTEDALVTLNSQLVDVTSLYGDFAEPFNLAKHKLAIVHCAGHYDPNLIESLWKDIINKELQESISLSVTARMTVFRQTLISLGKLYGDNERYFPSSYIIKQLELKSCELGFDISFVFSTLQDFGFSLYKLFSIYDKLIKSKEACWQVLKKPFHLLEVNCRILTAFVETSTPTPLSNDRRRFIMQSLDCIAGYLVELQATSSRDHSLTNLITTLKSLQAKLERISQKQI